MGISVVTSRLSLVIALGLLPAGVVLAQHGIEHPDKPDAIINTSEDIHDHEGQYEDIHDHRGHREDIHNHEGRAEDIHDHSADSGKLSDHHADSETLYGKVVESERLHGMGHHPDTTGQRLDAARQKLQAARERHAHHESRARELPAAADPRVAASSAVAGTRWEHWTARIDMAKERIGVAKAIVDVWDESYARMIQNDYPRGDARQELLDSRDRAEQRLASEEAMLPRMIEEARVAGVPPGVLELHASRDRQ
jgi:hypothetical protein